MELTTLNQLLQQRAAASPDRRAFTFLADDRSAQALSDAALDRQARSIAAELRKHTAPGDRALLIYTPGIDFIPAFFGCLYAGLVAVPSNYPKPRRPLPRHAAIVADCQAKVALSTRATIGLMNVDEALPQLRSLRWIVTDEVADQPSDGMLPHSAGGDEVALLQYTSGSTSEPKGVMISHQNLLHNLEVIRQGYDLPSIHPDGTDLVGVYWLPSYHDMGLIGAILGSLYIESHALLMSPASFLQRPLRWLQTISDHRATLSGAPNFAYELCVDKTTPAQRKTLDLSCWKGAICGSEPIRPETLDRFAAAFKVSGFSASALHPGYGLAEASLVVTDRNALQGYASSSVKRSALSNHRVALADRADTGDVVRLAACGRPRCGQEIQIVNPDTQNICESDEIGEVWIRGDSIAQGYWDRDELTRHTFGAQINGCRREKYLRSGDLGFLYDGELYITGRLKDLIIIRGQNHYPSDIENTVSAAHAALPADRGAAFSIERDRCEQLVIVHEVDRQHRHADFDEVIRKVRVAVALDHELDAHAVVLIRPASLPRTTSGKIRRSECRRYYLEDEFEILAEWERPPTGYSNWIFGPLNLGPGPLTRAEVERLAPSIEAALMRWLCQEGGVPEGEVGRDKPFAEIGLDSLRAVELSHSLEEWLQIDLTPIIAWNYPTPATMAAYLANKVGGLDEQEPEEPVHGLGGRFEGLLDEIESLSESDAESALRKTLGNLPEG